MATPFSLASCNQRLPNRPGLFFDFGIVNLFRDQTPGSAFFGFFYLVGAFIVSCGIGYLLDIWTLWHPAYWRSKFERSITALVFCYTALKMVDLLAKFLALKNPEQLDQLNQEMQK